MLTTTRKAPEDKYHVIRCERPPSFEPKRWDNIRPVQVKPTIAECIKAASEVFGVSVDDIKSKSRYRYQVYPRYAAIYVARLMTDASLPMIGYHVGNRDHTTIFYALNSVQGRLEKEGSFWIPKIKATRQRAKELANTRAMMGVN